MLSEEKRKKILEGVYCVTRAGKKAKLIYTSIYDKKYPYLFIIIDSYKKLKYHSKLNPDFKWSSEFDYCDDIIDLWYDHLDVKNH